MSVNWGPHYIVPSEVLKSYSGTVVLREKYDSELLQQELEQMNIQGSVLEIVNPWYYRQKGDDTWIKIGESNARNNNFPTSWNTTTLKDGQYEVMGLMHVTTGSGDIQKTIARQNIVEITINNQ